MFDIAVSPFKAELGEYLLNINADIKDFDKFIKEILEFLNKN